jgi:hypothetical protein
MILLGWFKVDLGSDALFFELRHQTNLGYFIFLSINFPFKGY